MYWYFADVMNSNALLLNKYINDNEFLLRNNHNADMRSAVLGKNFAKWLHQFNFLRFDVIYKSMLRDWCVVSVSLYIAAVC